MSRAPKDAPRPSAAVSWIVVSLALAGCLSGCSTQPTFSGDRLPESVEKIARDLYKLDVQTDLKGATLGVAWTGESLLDETGRGIGKEANEVIGNLSSAVSRVALSTDRPVDFIVVAARGIKEGMELRIVRRMDDIRRAQADALPVNESMNRTLFQQMPYNPEKEDGKPFDTGDWNLGSFLVKQILQRVRMAKPADTENPIPSELFDGNYLTDDNGQRTLEFSILTLKSENSKENVLGVLRAIREVFTAYRFDDFDQIVIRDLMNRRLLTIGRSTMKIYEAKKISEEELFDTRLTPDTGRTGAFKNSLEAFGFNIS